MEISFSDWVWVFVCRFLAFLITTIILKIAGSIAGANIVYKKSIYYGQFKKLEKRWTAARYLFFFGLVAAVFSIFELCINNRNEWLAMKISFYLAVWIIAGANLFGEADWALRDDLDHKYDIMGTIFIVSAFICTIVFVCSAIIGTIIFIASPIKTIDRKVENSTVLLAVNDGQRLNGEIFEGRRGYRKIVIFENSVYLYYYRAEDGGIKQGSVDADKTTIYYIEDKEAPHLDRLTSYSCRIHMRYNELHEDKINEETWYELYVPKGSVAESYVFDLN